MEKGPDAFRTISEVAEDLDLPQHVLRFWETRFPQIRPLKRGGGRRYYRPDDVELLRGIRHLLYGEGYTIRGVQRILKEEGPRYVQAIWRDVDADDRAVAELDRREEDAAPPPAESAPRPPEEAPRGGALGGILNLLPGRPRDTVEEVPSRRARRRPGDGSDHLDLPLLADLEPPARPVRQEPPPVDTGPARGAGDVPRLDTPQQGLPGDEPPSIEPLPAVNRDAPEVRPASLRPGYVEPRSFEPETGKPRPAEAPPRASFPFRPIGTGPVSYAPDEQVDFVPERARGVPFEAAPTEPPLSTSRAAPPAAPLPRAGGVQDDEIPARARLSRDDIQRLQAALYELQDCQRLLDAARDRDG